MDEPDEVMKRPEIPGAARRGAVELAARGRFRGRSRRVRQSPGAVGQGGGVAMTRRIVEPAPANLGFGPSDFPRALIAFVLATVHATASPANAATPAGPTLGPDAPPIAEQRYQDGRAAYNRGEFDVAASAFQSALDVHPGSAKLAYNLGRSHERRGHLDDAASAYRLYVALAPQAEDAAAVGALADSLEAQVRSARPSLILITNPPGALVQIDGDEVDEPTPARMPVDAGQHLVVVRLRDHHDAAESVSLSPGETWTLRFDLRAVAADATTDAAQGPPAVSRTIATSPWYDGRATGWSLVVLGALTTAAGGVLHLSAAETRLAAGQLSATPEDRATWRELDRKFDSQEKGFFICYAAGATLVTAGIATLIRAVETP